MANKSKITSGVPGLDEILAGGFPSNRLFLVEGAPGTGKTTLALQFLLEGVRLGEKVLYVTLSETEDELQEVASSHGWTLDGIDLYELEPLEDRLRPDEEYTVFRPEDVELGETMRRIYGKVELLNPQRAVFDSLSEMRLLARDPLRFRRQILALKQFFSGRQCTVLLLDDLTGPALDLQPQSICHGMLAIEKTMSDFGSSRRRVSIAKLRGVRFRDGFHDMAITTGGLVLYPRLVAAATRESFAPSSISSGVPELDKLLGGGLNRGSSTLFLGPAGSGKSSLAAMVAYTAAAQGVHSAIYIFEEGMNIFLHRNAGMGIDLQRYIESGLISLQQVDPAELSPGEFSVLVCKSVEEEKAGIVLIDSLNGYMNSMLSHQLLMLHMHELLMYLSQKQVVTLMTVAQHGMLGKVESPVELSYLADAVILLRFFEHDGELRQALSVMKNRGSAHERTIREMKLTAHGPVVSGVLREFRGVLSGAPIYTGSAAPLTNDQGETSS
jgi:circadian clock protein KaiC